MYYVYILENLYAKKKYIGSTSDVERRLEEHNKGSNRSTKPFRPYKLVYSESFENKTDALKRELQLKSWKGSKALVKLIKCWGGGVVNRTRL